MKKTLCSLVLVSSVLSSVAFAENDGFFVGGGLGWASSKVEKNGNDVTGNDLNLHGILGFKQFFDENFGVRVYGNLYYNSMSDMPSYVGTYYNIGANVDALYNFINQGSSSYGVFGGINLGFTFWNDTGFDTSLNFGGRAVFNEVHSAELAFRVPLQSHDLNDRGLKGKQTFNTMLRYVYSLY
ncbi:hypothetical protein DMB92_05795 [Campylobacter sp. MIT 99-7217]|uniref:outer membrane beta-barrel protein n=1 Tax=Campylobacter sp. MIT 99-7217 TaxID=535091 RepID=UPI001159DFAF|nr:outer membrane beta-barrel protein [Campylobacter sp. MIT 99-7217]TQR31890.1 hypothetical protein DMB92_05795 [Campylobacter sp. MIT 99-7217]